MTARFQIYREIGQGSFSKLYEAYDYKYQSYVALKVEKEDKLKRILRTEFEILKALQGVQHIPKVIEFVDNYNSSKPSQNLNCIEMELLGKNISNFKKTFPQFNSILAYDILLQALKAIENLHSKRYIHRDIKPTNFVLGKEDEERLNSNYSRGLHINDIHLYMVDFGLAKIHLDENMNPQPARQNAEFRGTLTYASLNAHYKTDLSRRDDLWSFFFMILDLLNENLPWRNCKDDKEDIKTMKEKCLNNPEANLFLTTTKGKKELITIYEHLYSLSYQSKPDYSLIHDMLLKLKMNEINIIAYRNFEYYYHQWNNINPIQQQLASMTSYPTSYPLGAFQQANTQLSSQQQQQPQPQIQVQAQAQQQQPSMQSFYSMALGNQSSNIMPNQCSIDLPVEFGGGNMNIVYDTFLNKKTQRNGKDEEKFNYHQANYPPFTHPIIKNTTSNNLTINNPTQNQIVIINQYQEEGLSKRILDYILEHMEDKANNNNSNNNKSNIIINDYLKFKTNNNNNNEGEGEEKYNYISSQSKMPQSSQVYYSFNNELQQLQQQQQPNYFSSKHNSMSKSSCPRPAASSSFTHNYFPSHTISKTKPDINNDKLLIDSIIQKLPQNNFNDTASNKPIGEKKVTRTRKKKEIKEPTVNVNANTNAKGESKGKKIFIINKKASKKRHHLI